MIYRSSISLLLTLCLNILTVAQISTVNIAGEQFSGRIAYFKDTKSKAILGNTYISKDWMIGSIETVSGHKTEGLVRLNALSKEIELVNGNDTVVISETFDIKKVNLGGLSFVTAITIEERGSKILLNTHFLNLLYDSSIQLLKKFDVKSYHNQYVPNYMGGAGDGNMYYRMGVSYYYRLNDGSAAYPLKRNANSIALVFGIEKNVVRNLIRLNKLSISKEKDLVGLFSILNAEKVQ